MHGPGGVKMITALVEGNTTRDWCTWLIAAVMPLVDGDIHAAGRLVMESGDRKSVV